MVRRTSTVASIWMALVAAAGAQSVDVELERRIELKGMPSASVPIVTSLAIHPAGHLLAAAGDDHLVRLWDITTGKLVHQLAGHRGWITSAAFCSDGRELVTGSVDRQVFVWDVARGVRKAQLGAHQHPVSSITVGPRGRVAVVGFRAPLQVFDLASRKLDRSLPCPCSDTRAVAFSSQERWLAAAGRNGIVRVWDLERGESFQFRAHDRRVRAILFGPDDNSIVSAGDDDDLGVWDLAQRRLVRRIPNPGGKVLSMTAVNEDFFAASGSDNLIRMYRWNGSEPVKVIGGHTGSIAALTARDGRLFSGGFDTTVRVWAMRVEDRPPRASISTRVISAGPTN